MGKTKELYTELQDELMNQAHRLEDISNEAAGFKDGYNGYKFEVRSGGTMYNYKHIPEWQTYKTALADCETRHKQAYLSSQKGLIVATEDGEEIEMPKISYRKSSLIIKKC